MRGLITVLVICLMPMGIRSAEITDNTLIDCTFDGRDGYENLNSGASAVMYWGMRLGATGQEERRLCIYFDAIPASDSVADSAYILLWVHGMSLNDDSLCFDLRRPVNPIHPYAGDNAGTAVDSGETCWLVRVEMGSAPDSAWEAQAGDVDSSTSYGSMQLTASDAGTWVRMDIDTALVNGWIRGDFPNYGIVTDIRNVTGVNRNDAQIHSAEGDSVPVSHIFYDAASGEDPADSIGVSKRRRKLMEGL